MRHLLPLSRTAVALGIGVLLPLLSEAQPVTNITVTNATAEQVLKGQYTPSDFAATQVIDDHELILCELRWALEADSLKSYLQQLEGFHTRHSYSDTLSTTSGIGAARRWAFAKFQEFSAANEDRLIPAYLQFDWPNGSCGDAFRWRNTLAVLPGSDNNDHQLIIIEAHLDSRCAGDCDTVCAAPGMEDNGSGSALVLELARVMSRYTFRHTIVFMLTTGEEQGLVGADAMAEWCNVNGIAIKGVLNNDIVGGVLCGETSSAPSCAPPGSVDSLQVRLFSSGSTSQPHRGFARSIKHWYQEKLQDQMAVPMAISIIPQEDRDGRGGDHIPFRQRGYRNLRFTSANEHGNASVDSAWYSDHQHTSTDVLGVDTDGDQVVDSFFVDFNYLQRNALINGMAATLLALGPQPPTFTVLDEPAGLRVLITGGFNSAYRIGVRPSGSDPAFEAVYLTTDTSFSVPGLLAGTTYYISAATVDASGIPSPFSREYGKSNDADTPAAPVDPLPYGLDCWGIGVPELQVPRSDAVLRAHPNPTSGLTTFTVEVPDLQGRHEAYLEIFDAQGRAVDRVPLRLGSGANTVSYLPRKDSGVYMVRVVVDGRVLASEQVVVVRE
jgi:hypothetical protein